MAKRKNFPTFAAVSFLVLFVAAFTLFSTNNTHAPEPLADPKTLGMLLLGEQPPTPSDESYATFHGAAVTPPPIANLRFTSRVLGATSPSDKFIEVDLNHQKLYAYNGNQKIFEFTVSTGKWGPTPTGTFHIWVKLKSTLMTGGEGADYYYLPNVPWVEFFYNDQVPKSAGYSLHGAYWHNNFGHPMSHGCVNMRIEDAATIYQWTTPVVTNPDLWATYATADNPGTEIIIFGTPPAE